MSRPFIERLTGPGPEPPHRPRHHHPAADAHSAVSRSLPLRIVQWPSTCRRISYRCPWRLPPAGPAAHPFSPFLLLGVRREFGGNRSSTSSSESTAVLEPNSCAGLRKSCANLAPTTTTPARSSRSSRSSAATSPGPSSSRRSSSPPSRSPGALKAPPDPSPTTWVSRSTTPWPPTSPRTKCPTSSSSAPAGAREGAGSPPSWPPETGRRVTVANYSLSGGPDHVAVRGPQPQKAACSSSSASPSATSARTKAHHELLALFWRLPDWCGSPGRQEDVERLAFSSSATNSRS